MATLDINNPKYYDPFIKTLKENTHINNHTENSNLIVYNFGTETQKTIMKDIVKHHEKEGYCHCWHHLEYYMLKDVINNMDNKQLANKIRGCL